MKYLYSLLTVLVIVSGCSRKNEEQLYSEAREAEQQKNLVLAIERYDEIVTRFTSTSLAESSQYRVAVLYNSELREMRKAVAAYLKFHDLFPQSKEAAPSLFMAGFILNNELHSLDSAKLIYESFLQKYPNHELAGSARFELESLGKDPSEFIQSVPPPNESAKQPSGKAASDK